MNPLCVPFATTNMGSAMVAIDLGWMGPNYSISTACATSNFCILNAANHIIKVESDRMLCGGPDSLRRFCGMKRYHSLYIEGLRSIWGVSREDVNYVNAQATSTQTGDLKEYQSIIRCFGQNPDLRVNSTKSMIGHLLRAAGAVEAVALVQAIRTGWVHPNVNLENPEEGVDFPVKYLP
ncbi:hypothetical protein MKX01_020878, partial [Papaver californicum]